jgi:hypothetical protein
MTDLEQQLRDYGTLLDALDVDPVVVAEAERSHPSLLALVGAVTVVALLVGGSVALAARHDSSGHVKVEGGGGKSTRSGVSEIQNAHPTFAQDVARLEGLYAHAVADAPGGRPILQAEFEVCDYRSVPALGTGVRNGFASYFPLAEALTEARLVDGCLHRDDIPKGTTAPRQLCAADVRGPVYDPKATVVKLATKPVVLFGASGCGAAGYAPFTPALLAEINHRRKTEIEIRAVPRSCPTLHEAADWVVKITGQELGAPWPVVEPRAAASAPSGPTPPTTPPSSASTTAGNCVRAAQIDWDTWLVTLERF